MKIKLKKLHKKAIIPKHAHSSDAGLDLFTIISFEMTPNERKSIPTGIAIEIPEGYVGLIWDKSGLSHKYGIKTDSAGNWVYDWDNNKIVPATDGYSRPQASACFIQSVEDDLMSMQNLQKSETRLFKYGSGTGTNFSNLRGNKETLSGGGKSSLQYHL